MSKAKPKPVEKGFESAASKFDEVAGSKEAPLIEDQKPLDLIEESAKDYSNVPGKMKKFL